LLVRFYTRSNSFTSFTAGWTVLGTPTQVNAAMLTVAYKIAASGAESDPVLTKSGSNECVTVVSVIKDHDAGTTAPTITYADISPQAFNAQTPAVASVPAETLTLMMACDANNITTALTFDLGDVAAFTCRTWNVVQACEGYRVQNATGAAFRANIRRSSPPTSALTVSIQTATVTIANSSGGTLPVQTVDAYQPVITGGRWTMICEQNPTFTGDISGTTGDAATDVLTKVAHGLADGDLIIFRSITGGTGIVVFDRAYRVFASTADTFKISADEQANAVNFTSNITASVIQKLNTTFYLPMSNIAATIDGLATLDKLGQMTHAGSVIDLARSGNVAPGTAGWFGLSLPAGTYTGGTIDLSNKTLTYRVSFATNVINTMGAKGGIVGITDGTEWVAYRLTNKTLAVANTGVSFTVAIDPTNAVVYAKSAGTINLAAVTRVFVAMHQTNAANTVNFRVSAIYAVAKPMVYTNGSATLPINVVSLFNQVDSNPIFAGISPLSHCIQLGDGSTKTYVNMFGDAMTSASTYAIDKFGPQYQANIGSGTQRWSIKPCAACTMIFPSVIKSTLATRFTVDPASSASATYDTACQVIGCEPVWKTGIPATGLLFDGDLTVDGKGNTFVGCTFRRPTATALKLDTTGASATACAFTSLGTGHAIEVTATGTYDLTGTTFSGYSGTSTDATVYNNSGGAVTLLRAYADAAITVRNSAGSSTTIQNPAVYATATCLTGSHVALYNQTQDTWLYNDTLAGTSFSLQITPDIADHGDILELRVSKLGYQDFTGLSEFSAGSGSAYLVSQPSDDLYTALGVDGSTVTEFEIDVPNLDIDADDVDGLSQKRRLAAFLRYIVTTDDGARYFWNAITLEDEGNGRINTDVLNLLVDNVGTQQILFTDNDYRLYRSDDASWVKYPSTGGYGISQSSGKVYNANNAQIAAIKAKTDNLPSDPADQSLVDAAIAAIPAAPSAAATASAVRSELATELARIDAAITTRLSAASYVIPPTAADNADAVWDEVLTGATHNIQASAGRRLRQVTSSIIIDGVARGSGVSTNQIQLGTDASATNGAYDPAMVYIISGTGAGQCRIILQYVGSTRMATVHRSWRTMPDATSEYVIAAYGDTTSVNEGLAQGGGSNSITLNTDASSVNGTYVGQLVFLVSGTGEDQCGMVTAYDGTTKVATIDMGAGGGWTVIPDTTTAYVMMPASPVIISSASSCATQISAIKAKTDNLPSDPADQSLLEAAISAIPSAPSASANASAVRAELATELSRVDVAISSRLATAGYTAPANSDITAIKAKTDNLPTDPADQSLLIAAIDAIPAAPSAATTASAVRTELATELARVDVAVSSRNATAPDNASITAIKAKTDNLPSDPADNSQVLAAIAAIPTSSGATLAEIEASTVIAKEATLSALNNLSAAQVRTELSTELARIDVATSTRLSSAGYTAPANADITTIKNKVDDIHAIHGLDVARTLTVTTTSRTAGTIVQTIAGNGVTNSTMTRIA
jgi:hypothetical protein